MAIRFASETQLNFSRCSNGVFCLRLEGDVWGGKKKKNKINDEHKPRQFDIECRKLDDVYKLRLGEVLEMAARLCVSIEQTF